MQYSRLANGIAASFDLRVACVTGALTRRSAFSVLAILADWSTTSIGIGTISLQAGALVGCHTATVATAGITVGHAVLAAHGIQSVALPATAFVLFIAHPVATTKRAGGDALALFSPHMSRYANTRVGSRADAVGATIVADWIAQAKDVCVALIALAADLNATQLRCGAVTHHSLCSARSMQQ